jgi:putative glycosyltransferase
MKLSIVTTLYKSSPYVDEFYERISKEAQKITDNYEIIFVDDGSPDDSLQKCITLHQQDQKVTVVELSRNFGHHKAIMTGLSHAQGDFVFLIDVDLEEEPELLGKFWQELQNGADLDLIFGVQERRKGGWFERVSGYLYFKLLNHLSNVKIPENFLMLVGNLKLTGTTIDLKNFSTKIWMDL